MERELNNFLMMKIVALFVSILGLMGVLVTGVDSEAHSRSGFGLLVAGVGLLLMAGLVGWKGRDGKEERSWLSLLVLLGGGYFAVRAWLVGPVGLAIPDLLLVVCLLGGYFVTRCAGEGGRKWVVIGVGLVVVANLVVVGMQKYGGDFFYVWRANPGGDLPATGIFGHRNSLTGFLNGMFFFVLTLMFVGRPPWIRVMMGVLAVAMVGALWLTESRGGFVGLLGGLVAWVVMSLVSLKSHNSRYFGGALIAGVFVAVVGMVSVFTVVKKVEDRRSGVEAEASNRIESSDGERFEYHGMALEVFQRSPLLGSGPRAYSYLSLEEWDPEDLALFHAPPEMAHNEFFQTLSDYGMVGFLILLVLLFMHGVFGIFDVAKKSEGILKIGAAAGLVAVLVQCYFSFLIHIPAIALLVGVLLAILASGVGVSRGVSRKRGGFELTKLGGVVTAVMLLGASLFFIPVFLGARDVENKLNRVDSFEGGLKAVHEMIELGKRGRDPLILEESGRLASRFASVAAQKKDKDFQMKFHEQAKESFEAALEFNPHLSEALIGLPRQHDALGNWEEAEKGHLVAMEKLKVRANQLKPHYYGALSSWLEARRRLRLQGDRGLEDVLGLVREGQRRIGLYEELTYGWARKAPEKELMRALPEWVQFVEGAILMREGHEVWMKRRPRNPELAYGLFVEAGKRFSGCEVLRKGKQAELLKRQRYLSGYVSNLQAGMVKPEEVEQELIDKLLQKEVGLDSGGENR